MSRIKANQSKYGSGLFCVTALQARPRRSWSCTGDTIFNSLEVGPGQLHGEKKILVRGSDWRF